MELNMTAILKERVNVSEVMTPAQKESIIRLKFETPADKDYHGVEYYEAVIADGIDNMADFEKWVLEHRKKPMHYWILK